jgi:[citrate (pro-3S)-lyase] ligase
MNCNPFTLGHRYLIETASKQVDTLYIFVVEENKSFFEFEDRYQLVKAGTQDLENVVVLPSGKFIISALTFPGYFYKDNNKDAVVDTSKDVDLFGKYIAKILNIKVRFVGEEPIDMVTRQYNRSMQERLPLYGIEVMEIKRKEMGAQVISASRVRKCLENKDFEGIRELVPETTYEYLVKKYS